jgi:hypothetical protein
LRIEFLARSSDAKASVTGDVCASDQVGFMGSRWPIKVKAFFVVAILTDPAQCEGFLTLFQRRTDSPVMTTIR